jgi:small subunit ribosomal protein S16
MHGVRNNRILHLVAIDGRKRRNAMPIETLGIYDPKVQPGASGKTVRWSVDRINYWLGVGAEPSKPVVRLLTVVRVVSFVHFAPVLTHASVTI